MGPLLQGARTQGLSGAQLSPSLLTTPLLPLQVRYFKEDAELVKRSRDASGQWHGKWAPINRMCQLAHNLLRLLVVGNRRCADTLQSIDAVEVLLKQLPLSQKRKKRKKADSKVLDHCLVE